MAEQEGRPKRRYEESHASAMIAALAKAKRPEPPKSQALSARALLEKVGDALAETVKREKLTLDQAVAIVKTVKLGAEDVDDGKGGRTKREIRLELSDRELRRVVRDVVTTRKVEFAT